MGKKSQKIPAKRIGSKVVKIPRKSNSSLLVQQAEELWRDGRRQQARAVLNKLLQNNPQDVAALHLYAIVTAESGDPKQALIILEKAIGLNQRDPNLRLTYGNILNSLGFFKKAEEAFRKALKRQPNFPQANNGLGMALSGQKCQEEAVKYYKMAIRQKDDFIFAHANLGAAYLEVGEVKEAVKVLQRASNISPKNYGIENNLGSACFQDGDIKSAISHFQAAAEINPNDSEALINLASIGLKSDYLDEAGEALQAIFKNQPDHQIAIQLYGDLLIERGEVEASIVQYQRLYDVEDCAVLGRIKAGRALAYLGQFTEAEEAYKGALEIDPTLTSALSGLSKITKNQDSGEVMEQMEFLLESEGLSDGLRRHLHFSLGKCCDDAGLFKKGFVHYHEGNELKGVVFDPVKNHDYISSLIETFNAEFFAKWEGIGDSSIRPVFILGMPRSGTTLTEQILASHPAVFGGGEQEYFPKLCRKIEEEFSLGGDFPVCLEDLRQSDILHIIKDYNAHLDGLSGVEWRIVDKMPGNFLNVGLIRLLFPKAKIIHTRRSPIDNCLSIYFQDFAGNFPYAYDLANIGIYYKEYERLMAHWEKLFPGQMLDHQYEDVIASQEAMTRRLIDYVELEWDDSCLEFHKTKRAVKTASIWQARQPIYSSSVERWRNYEPYLGPLKQALGVV